MRKVRPAAPALPRAQRFSALAAAVALAGALAGCSAHASRPLAPPERPERIVSINPCVDALLRELADPPQIRAIRHYSQDPRAAALSAAIDAAVAGARASGPPAPALIWQGGGLVPGDGTLADELLAATGHANMASAHGLGAWGVLGLERLVARPPAIRYAGERGDSATGCSTIR